MDKNIVNFTLITGNIPLCFSMKKFSKIIHTNLVERFLETNEILAIFLAKFCEKALPEYFASLPLEIDHCLYWSASDIGKMDSEIKKEFVRYTKDYEKHRKQIERFFDIKEENFRLAWVQLNTRTIYLPGRVA